MAISSLTGGGVAALTLFAGAALAQSRAGLQSWPTRPIRIIVPGSAGSANDITARAIAVRLTETWGQQIVIDNRW